MEIGDTLNSGSATELLSKGIKTYPLKEFELMKSYCKNEAMNPYDFYKGTTTLGFVFNEGIILAVDSRASMGLHIYTHAINKVVEINSYLLGTMAGGASDCTYWERYLAKLCRLHELRHQSRISVGAASQQLANIFMYFRGYGLVAGVMIAGWDKNKGPSLYYVSSEGDRVKGRLFSVGSGSIFAYGVIDSGYRSDMTVDEAVELGKRAIYQAAHRDGFSGGNLNLYHIHENGWTRMIHHTNIADLHFEYNEEKGLPMDAM